MSSGLYNTHKIDFDTTLDLTRLKPYGDTMNDGKVQTSFTLPIKDDERGEEAARQIAKKMGLEEPNVAYHTALDKEFTFYVVYGSCVHSVNYEDIHVITVESDVMSMEDTNEYIKEHIGRKVVMVGASTGTDAHTVGIDAIMNRKGFAGHYGLERYEMIEAYNLGSQVPNEEFIKKALELHADVLLVSQTVTQKDVHIQNLTNLIELLEAEGAEAVVPDLLDFFNYSIYGRDFRHKNLGTSWKDSVVAKAGVEMLRRLRAPALEALEKSRRFEAPMPIEDVAKLAEPFLAIGNQYGEGWFLTGEMAELLTSGTPNIVCIQPFACLPNHVVGKGVIKALRKSYPWANIVAVDYDPGASEVNQLNRIKLMLSSARRAMHSGAAQDAEALPIAR